MIKNKAVLFVDIETSPLQAWIWRTGEQRIRQDQLVNGRDSYHILCICWKWLGKKEVHSIDIRDKDMIEKFDKEISKADIIITKNGDSFDLKHINSQRMIQGKKALPWMNELSDDLEKQLRRHFYLPSFALDYVSKQFGFGGKSKMEFADWIAITNEIFELEGRLVFPLGSDGRKALEKMIKYCKKDVSDTEAVFKKVLPYIKLKHYYSEKGCCTSCGSNDIIPERTLVKSGTRYQLFHCSSCDSYAGKATLSYDKNRHKKFGRMQK